MMDTHQRLALARGLIRSHLNSTPHAAGEVWISFMRELMDGILVVYQTGEPNVSLRHERVAFFTTGTVDNHPAVQCEWDNPCEPQ